MIIIGIATVMGTVTSSVAFTSATFERTADIPIGSDTTAVIGVEGNAEISAGAGAERLVTVVNRFDTQATVSVSSDYGTISSGLSRSSFVLSAGKSKEVLLQLPCENAPQIISYSIQMQTVDGVTGKLTRRATVDTTQCQTETAADAIKHESGESHAITGSFKSGNSGNAGNSGNSGGAETTGSLEFDIINTNTDGTLVNLTSIQIVTAGDATRLSQGSANKGNDRLGPIGTSEFLFKKNEGGKSGGASENSWSTLGGLDVDEDNPVLIGEDDTRTLTEEVMIAPGATVRVYLYQFVHNGEPYELADENIDITLGFADGSTTQLTVTPRACDANGNSNKPGCG
ncbi:MAG: hypothetical protein J07HQW1_01471 [Haloquadratum walsbyi J07HQW1]|uniref:Uncharacterized protein n=1 Tax=Haloquadratum walsbyi J07HQW1 TaxID=1238424 RepID=U1PCY9_9EURY|nr:MAG: hypothetical protein J07HQW1_01471 [Haloquadratum walsbyi J07HQW1]